MKRLYKHVFIFWCVCGSGMLNAQYETDYIEREYYDAAQAQNEALSAARYAEEAYFYTHQANNRGELDNYRADLDTVLFYLRKSTELAEAALASMAENDTIQALLERGIARLSKTNGVLRQIYPYRQLATMRQYSDLEVGNLMHAKIDFYTASLYLSDGQLELSDEDFVYRELDLDQHVARLDADEAAFTDLVLDLEKQLADINQRIAELQKRIAETTDPEEKARLEKELAELLAERDRLENNLRDAARQLQTIRDMQQQRMEQAAQNDIQSAVNGQQEGSFETDRHGYYDDKNVEVNIELPQGLVYRIQLGYFFQSDSKDAFHGLFPITGEDLGDGKIRYYAGMFTSYQDASRAKSYIREKRIGDAFVVPYLDGKKINVKQAIDLEQKLSR